MKFLVTAGPTREHLDPVRFLSNPSSGKMGFAVAAAAIRAGHEAVLVAGPVSLRTPRGARRIDVVSACGMLDALKREIASADVLVMSAAVADWRPAECSASKLKKSEMDGVLRLVRNPDILQSLHPLKGSRFFAGFAAETGDPEAEALRKMRDKGLDMIIANDVSSPGCGFAVSTNRVSVYCADGSRTDLPLMRKSAVAARIVKMICALARGREAGCRSH